jgi:uncharacterized lipoprotein YddW (UPF0748 family)
MKRRAFIEQAGRGALAAALAPSALACARDAGTHGGGEGDVSFKAWAWVHGDRDHDLATWRSHFARIREAGIEGVLIGGGEVDLLAEATTAEGLTFHRWLWTLNRNSDSWVQENHPEWFTVSRNGESTLEHPPYVGYYKWLCPTRQPVRTYVAEQFGELAAGPIDAVHLDYVRHSDVILPRALWATYDIIQDQEYAEYDFCYCEVCREAFAGLHGRDPMELEDPQSDEAWRRFRWDSVTGLVAQVAEQVHGRGKILSAAVFPTPTIARQLVRQAWEEWPVDMVFPMLYNSFYEEGIPWIGAGVREGVAALGGRPLHAGLYLPDLPPSDLVTAVTTAREAGASGVSFFQMEALTDEHLAALKGVLG